MAYRIPTAQNYTGVLNATNFRGYLRDEMNDCEIVLFIRMVSS